MPTRSIRWTLAFAGAAISLGACARTPQTPPSTPSQSPTTAHAGHAGHAASAAPAPTAARQGAPRAPVSDGRLPRAVVHRSPTCGCCGGWVEHLRRHGFTADVRMTDDLEPVRKRLGVPAGKGSCHTAEIGGLVVEGHVPAGDVQRLLARRDGSRGLVLPGMPLGSPGMETPDGRVQRYTVERIGPDGRTTPFATHGE